MIDNDNTFENRIAHLKRQQKKLKKFHAWRSLARARYFLWWHATTRVTEHARPHNDNYPIENHAA